MFALALHPGLKLRRARETRYPSVSQYDLADSLGLKRATLASYEMERARPPRDVVSKISRLWGIPESWFFDGEDTMPPEKASSSPTLRIRQTGSIKLLEGVPAGQWSEAIDNADTIEVDQRHVLKERWAVPVRGDSMTCPNGTGLLDGDIVIIQPSQERIAGLIFIATNEAGAATIKQVVREGARWRLKPLNPAAEPTDADEMHLTGYAVEVIRLLDRGTKVSFANENGLRPEDLG